jgi:hypothetical protein
MHNPRFEAEYPQHPTYAYDKHIFAKLLDLMARLDPHAVLNLKVNESDFPRFMLSGVTLCEGENFNY